MTDACTFPRGLTVADVARLLRVGEDKVRVWIKSGALIAIDTSDPVRGKPRYVILPDALAAFTTRRAVATPQPKPRRRRTAVRDYYPD